MKEVKKVIEELETEIQVEKNLYFSDYASQNETTRSWSKGYIKGLNLSISKLKNIK